MLEEIQRRFGYRELSKEQQARVDTIRRAFKEAARAVLLACVDERERALALTKLEEAAMWAIKSVSIK